MSDYDRYLEAKKLYNTNEKFHTFVNRCCESYGYDLYFALTVKTIQDVGEYYENNILPEGPVCVSCELEGDDKAC